MRNIIVQATLYIIFQLIWKTYWKKAIEITTLLCIALSTLNVFVTKIDYINTNMFLGMPAASVWLKSFRKGHWVLQHPPTEENHGSKDWLKRFITYGLQCKLFVEMVNFLPRSPLEMKVLKIDSTKKEVVPNLKQCRKKKTYWNETRGTEQTMEKLDELILKYSGKCF